MILASDNPDIVYGGSSRSSTQPSSTRPAAATPRPTAI